MDTNNVVVNEYEDEIDLKEMFGVLWSGKIKIIIITAIFAACLLGGVYIYAYWATTSGSLEDENQNFIPDSWEKNFKWLFTGKTIIMLILGLIIGYLIGSST